MNHTTQSALQTSDMAGIRFLSFISGILTTMLVPGMTKTALKQIRGEEISVGDLFSAIRFFWGTFVARFVTAFGLLACCVGIVFTNGLLFMALPLMIDRDMPTMQAISLSWSTASRNIWLYVLFTLVITLLTICGLLGCYVGLFATMSFMPIAQAVAYARTFGMPGIGLPTAVPGSIPPPYAGGMPAVAAPAATDASCCPLCGAKRVEGIELCPQCGTNWNK